MAQAGSAAQAAADGIAGGGSKADDDESMRLCDEGLALLDLRRFAEAQATLARARALDPSNPLAHYRLGLVHADMRRPRDALACFDAAHALAPEDVRIVNNRGSALQLLGRLPEAEAAFRRACQLAPESQVPLLNLGHLLEEMGRKSEAANVYRDAIGRGIQPALFEHHLAALTGQDTARAPEDWVIATFDNFAPTFDAHLRSLRYEVPRHLASWVAEVTDVPLDIVDLGCGTGACGLHLAPRKRRLVGIDLSPRMAAQARARKVYDEVIEADVHGWLAATPDTSFDLVCAADVFIYIGALDTVFADVWRILRPGGWFAFSTEECQAGDHCLLPSGRYAQSEDYIRRLAAPFDVVRAEPAVIRMEERAALPGRLFMLRKGTDAHAA